MRYRKIKRILNYGLFFLILLLSFQLVSAAGVSPSTVDIPYYPGENYNIAYNVIGYNDIELEMGCPFVKLNGDINSDGTNHRFTITVELPEEWDAEPGIKNCGFMIREKTPPDMPPGVAAFVEVGTNIFIHVPYEGRYASLDLSVDNVNQGDPVYFLSKISNLGEDDLNNLLVQIDVYDLDDNLKQTLYTEMASVERFQNTDLWKKMETIDYEPARYKAVATLKYLGEPAMDEEQFLIGKLFVNFVSMTPNITIGKISPVKVKIESWWGNPIKDVHAEVEIFNETGTLITFQTVSQDLGPWAVAELEGFLDATLLSAGEYQAKVTLLYEDEITESLTSIELLEELKEKDHWQNFKSFLKSPAFLVVVLALLLVINILVWKFRKKGGKNEKN